MRSLLRAFSLVLIVSILAAIVVSACGKSAKRPTGQSVSSEHSFIDSKTESIEDAVAGIESLAAPAGVDESVFKALKLELAKQLGDLDSSRFAAAAPQGDSGRVTNLSFNKSTGVLSWNYANTGDYDVSGAVGVSDITPIALNYLQIVGSNPLFAWIDGDKDGIIGIADITTIALNYLNDVQGYNVYQSDDGSTGWTELGSTIPFGTQGSYPKRFTLTLTPDEPYYVAVRAVGSGDSLGEMSNVALVEPQTGEPAVVTDASPKSGESGQLVNFSATLTGSAPFTFQWDFGGGATPNTSSEVSPTVTLGAQGTYDASVVVDNDWGDPSTFDFTLTVDPPSGVPPNITGVSPTGGITGTSATFNASVTGTAPLSFDWSFGGGATPNTSTSQSPNVTLGAVGAYNATVTVSNAYGNDSFPFTLNVSGLPSWQTETVETSPSLLAEWINIDVDSSNKPHIVYRNQINSDLKYAKKPTTMWQIETIEARAGNGLYANIAVDGNDNPHVSYFYSTEGQIKYAFNGGASWQITTAYDLPEGSGDFTGIAVDSTNRAHISFAQSIGFSTLHLYYARDTGSSWQSTAVDTSGRAGSFSSIALDSNNRPHISYCDVATLKLMYAHFDGSSWSITTVDGSPNTGYYTSIAIGPNNRPQISYYAFADNNLHYASFNGSSWSTQTVDSGNQCGQYSSIEVDGNNRPHIAYLDNANKDVKYAHHNGSSWQITTVDSEGNVGFYTSLALDSFGLPHIAYQGPQSVKYAFMG